MSFLSFRHGGRAGQNDEESSSQRSKNSICSFTVIDSIQDFYRQRHSMDGMGNTYLAVTDHQELIPLLSASASSKDVIESDVIFRGVLSDLNYDITKRKADKLKARAEAEEATDFTQKLQNSNNITVRKTLRTS